MYKYQRLIENTINRLKRPQESKIIAILGNRQVGKTTLLDYFASHWHGPVAKYLGDKLEDAILWRGKFSEVKNNLELNLKASLEAIKEPCLLVFDEAQKVPEAFNNLKILHDSYKGKIKIAISGSSSLQLLGRTSESLGGRVEIATMYPLSFTEILNSPAGPVWMERSVLGFEHIKNGVIEKSDIARVALAHLDKAFVFGLFPEAHLLGDIDEAKLVYQNYHQTYIEKDIRNLKEVGNVLDFDMVWKIAHRTNGQLLSYSNISRDTGISFNTVKKYISVLGASFNILLLSPFTRNIKRRVIKSPKIFSQDLGYFNHCLGIFNKESLIASGLAGRAFESMMIMEFFKQERSFLIGGEPYFFRTSNGQEVDLVVERGQELFAYEFKLSEKVSKSDFVGIKSLEGALGRRLRAGFVVSCQAHAQNFSENLFAVPWWYFCI